ncbi:hypothetical protein [Nocardia farcinica]|uniref:hypothetical protein n=1 Tax=Nocardia farcinica TaxID=37329 RepID=UPI0018953031|nr:hypothetical protein [Nocardia farcinica]MBF6573772.1 hypothetical protein [Nocardia farcinica]
MPPDSRMDTDRNEALGELLEALAELRFNGAAKQADQIAGALIRLGVHLSEYRPDDEYLTLAELLGITDEARRYDIAVRLGDVPAACWSDLMDWARRGYVLVEHEDGTFERSPIPRTGTALPCMVEAIEQARPCYCGRFGATRALPAAALDPVDADVDDETADEYDEPDPDLAHDRRVADQLGVL